jgi:hypothetical protein
MLTHAELRDLVKLELRVHELPLNDTDLSNLIVVSVSELTGLFDLVGEVRSFSTVVNTTQINLGSDIKRVWGVWYRPSGSVVFDSYNEVNEVVNGQTVKVAYLNRNTSVGRGFVRGNWSKTGVVQWERGGWWYEFPYEVVNDDTIRLTVYAPPSQSVVPSGQRPVLGAYLFEKADWVELRPIGWQSSFQTSPYQPFNLSTNPPSSFQPLVEHEMGYGLSWVDGRMVLTLRLPNGWLREGRDNLRVYAVLYYEGGDPIPLPKSFSRLITVMVCRRILQSFMGEEVANYLALYKREEDELKSMLYRQMESWGTYPVQIRSAYALEEGGIRGATTDRSS